LRSRDLLRKEVSLPPLDGVRAVFVRWVLWVGAYLLRASATMLLSVAMSATPGTTLSPITKAGVPRMLRASASFRF
jgi:hypothetical protein